MRYTIIMFNKSKQEKLTDKLPNPENKHLIGAGALAAVLGLFGLVRAKKRNAAAAAKAKAAAARRKAHKPTRKPKK